MYQQDLSKQWTDLIDDFISENQSLPQQTSNMFNKWYQVNVHRFNSITSIESITLDQLENKSFSMALRAKINHFEFHKPAENVKSDPRKGIVIAAAVGIIIALFLPIVPFNWSKSLLCRILLGMIVFIGLTIMQIKRTLSIQQKEEKLVFDEYVHQLKAYLPELIAVCNEYNIV